MKSLTAFVVAASLCVSQTVAADPCSFADGELYEALTQGQLVTLMAANSDECGHLLTEFLGVPASHVTNIEPVYGIVGAEVSIRSVENGGTEHNVFIEGSTMTDFFNQNAVCQQALNVMANEPPEAELWCFNTVGKRFGAFFAIPG